MARSSLPVISIWMGDCLRTGKSSWHVTVHRGQLSLAFFPWIRASRSLPYSQRMVTLYGSEDNRGPGEVLWQRPSGVHVHVYPTAGCLPRDWRSTPAHKAFVDHGATFVHSGKKSNAEWKDNRHVNVFD